jgi:hypothetical protein
MSSIRNNERKFSFYMLVPSHKITRGHITD